MGELSSSMENGVELEVAAPDVPEKEDVSEKDKAVVAPSPEREREETPIPVFKTATVVCVTLTEGFTGSVLIPFVAFMIQSFGHDQNSGSFALWAGLLTSAFYLGQFFSSTFSGQMSDKIGRRPMLLAGLFANAFCMLAFGFSTNIAMAVFIRWLNGMFNGSVGIVKSYVREVTDETNQAKVYSFRSGGYAAGMILGPMTGGILSRPAMNWPNVFGGTIFEVYPFLLPCVAAIFVNIISFSICYPFLAESLDPVPNIKEGLSEFVDECKCGGARESRGSFSERRGSAGLTWTLLKEKSVAFSIGLYMLIGLVNIAFMEVFAFWVVRDMVNGGLNYVEKDIGQLQAMSAFAMLFCQVFLYSKLDTAIGSLNVWRLSCFVGAPMYFMVPLSNNLMLHGMPNVAIWILLAIVLSVIQIHSTAAYSSVNIMISNVAPLDHIGAVNGISASGAAFSRMLAPIVGGAIFSLSVSLALPYPLDSKFLFNFCAGLCIIMGGLSFLLDPNVVNKRRLTKLSLPTDAETLIQEHKEELDNEGDNDAEHGADNAEHRVDIGTPVRVESDDHQHDFSAASSPAGSDEGDSPSR